MSEADSVTTHVDRAGWSGVTWLMFCACGLYWLADAIELGLMTYLVPQLQLDWEISRPASDAVAAVVFAGICIGALAWGVASDRWGRRKIFLLTAAGTGLFGVASAFSPNVAGMLVLRFCCGLFLGGGPAAYSLYLEFLPRRSLWVMTFFNLWFTVGSLLEAVLAFVVLSPPSIAGYPSWRWLVGLSSTPILLLSLVFPFIRESPHWLVASGATDKAEDVIDSLYRAGGKVRTTAVAAAETSAGRGNLRTLFSRELVRRTTLFMAIWFCVNLIFYGVSFFATAYFLLLFPPENRSSALLILVVVSSGEVIGALAAAFMISRGIRRAVICSTLLAVCGLFLFLLLVTEDVYARMAFSLVSRAAVFGAFATVYLWTPLTIPANVRTSAMGLMSSFGKIASICAPFISSSFNKTDVLVPAVLFGSTATAAAVLAMLVGVEPSSGDDEKDSDDETKALVGNHGAAAQ